MLDNEDAMQEIPPISVVFKEYRAYYLRRKKELNEMLKALPLKGSVRRKGRASITTCSIAQEIRSRVTM
jgi:hypothetical protein